MAGKGLGERVAERLKALGLTVAVAKCSTGGHSGGADGGGGQLGVLPGGIVPYDNRSKTAVLGAPVEVFVEHGSVSAEACLAMAEAVRALFDADIGLAETGIAGPGGATSAKPVGLSYVAIAGASRSEVREGRFGGGREENQVAGVEAALRLLVENLGRP